MESSDLYSLGYQLIPLVGKRPAGEWKDLQSERKELKGWSGNVGIVTGKISGCVVLDCDSEESYDWARGQGFRSPMVVRTARGWHLYFRYRPIGNFVRVGGRLLDIRGDAGYCVCPPSVHSSGVRYEWKAGPVPPDQLPELPMIEPLRQQQTLTQGRVQNLTAYLAKIESVEGRNGSAGLVRAASVCRDSGLSPAVAMAELVKWNSSPAVRPPWTRADLARAVDRVFKGGSNA
jgi:hypothetical protein